MDPDSSRPVRLAGDTVATRHDWDVAAAAVLRKAKRLAADAPDAAAWDTLATRTVEGLVVPPLGTGELSGARGAGLPVGDAGLRAGRAILRAESGWDIRAVVAMADPAAAAAVAVEELENGASSLWLTVGGAGTAPGGVALALAGVLLDIAPVVLSARGSVTDGQAARALVDVLEQRGVSPDSGGCLGADPVGRAVRSAGLLPDRREVISAWGEIAALATAVGVRAGTVDGSVAHDAGAGDAAELGYVLAVGAEYLRALETSGCDAAAAFGLLDVRLAATGEQFATIAKFRAVRGLWRRIAELSGVPAGSGEPVVHAVTSRLMVTRYDPWVNLLRTTVAAFAAGVGGADAVTVLPFDSGLGVPDALGRRLARNISSLLISESHVAAVDDPAGGSYAVEVLTAELADAAWAEFGRIEAAGGIGAALAAGSVQERWAVTAAQRARRVATRRQPITGVSEFPQLREVLPTRQQTPAGDDRPVVSWAAPFEELRDAPTGAPVFLATLGPVAEHAARAGFAANLFAAGGVDTVSAGRTGGVEDVLAAFDATDTTVACLAGADSAYAESGVAVVDALRAAGATRIILAGRPGGALAAAVDDHVAVGDDVLDFLRRTRQYLPAARGLDEAEAKR